MTGAAPSVAAAPGDVPGPRAFYVIVRGPLGAGKSTLSARLAEALGGVHIPIDRILLDHDLERWGSVYISLESFCAANVFAAAEAEVALRDGRPAVVDGNFYWREAIDDLRRRLPFPGVTFTLHLPVEACTARDAARVPSLGAEGARLVHAKVTSFEYGRPLDARPPVEVVLAAALDGLRTARMPGMVAEPRGAGRGDL